MLGTLLIKFLKNKIINGEEIKMMKEKRRRTKKAHKKQMIKLFGKTRYYLAWWFGEWLLYTFNNRDYSCSEEEKAYQETVENLKPAAQYAEKLSKKYERVKVLKVYEKGKGQIGYIFRCIGKKVADATQQPSANVTSFAKFKAK